MIFTETSLEGAFTIEVERLSDERGFFGRIWCLEEFSKMNLNTNLVQSNVSMSLKKGTLRGMHFQLEPYQETKLIRCTRGSVYDVIVDLRPNSKTFKKWFGTVLSSNNHKMVYVPEGFAHGFLTLEDNSEVYYLVTEYYSKDYERGLRWNDPEIGIKWPETITEVSIKDRNHPDFNL